MSSIKTTLGLVGGGGCLIFALLMSYEFIELLTNILYTIILTIIIAFFYQNRDQAISTVYFLLNIDHPSSSSSPSFKRDFELNNQNNNQNNNNSPSSSNINIGVIGQKSEKEIIAQLYDQIKELNLSFFNEKLGNDRDKINSQNRIKVLETSLQDANNDRTKLKTNGDQLKQRLQEISKEKDSVQNNEQKLLLKLSDHEKKERVYMENEKVLSKKISELKEQCSTLRKDGDEKLKRIVKLEDQVAKLNRPLPVTPVTANININGNLNSQPQQQQPKEQPINNNNINNSSTTNPQTISLQVINSNSSSNNNNPSPLASPGTSPSSSTIHFPIPSSDDEFGSSYGGGSSIGSNGASDTPKPLKSLIKKVKNGSSKIINKAQKEINKHLNTDFFTPPPASQQPQHIPSSLQNIFNNNTSNNSSFKPSQDNALSSSPSSSNSSSSSSITPPIIVNNNNKQTTTPINSDNVPDIFTFEDDSTINGHGNESALKIDLTSSLSDLLQFDSNTLNVTLSSFVDRPINNDKLMSTLQQSCIKEYSIKESENKAGLRRAKKKPLSGVSGQNMMEDVSFALHPFNENYEVALFGVLDGHAGREAADSARTHFPIQIAKLLEQPTYSPSSCQDMTEMFKEAFATVDAILKQEDMEYVGCTATVCLVWTTADEERFLQVANVGDSSAFLSHNSTTLTLTYDHKASDPLEKKRMIDNGIAVSENQTRINGIAVSRSLGNHFIKDQNIGMIALPHISNPIKLLESDPFFIIASDGLWDVVSGDDAIQVGNELIDSRGAQSVASTLLTNALQFADCKDNVTVIVVKL